MATNHDTKSKNFQDKCENNNFKKVDLNFTKQLTELEKDKNEKDLVNSNQLNRIKEIDETLINLRTKNESLQSKIRQLESDNHNFKEMIDNLNDQVIMIRFI